MQFPATGEVRLTVCHRFSFALFARFLSPLFGDGFMTTFKSTFLTAFLVAATLTLGACASSGYDAAGYNAIEKNGRLYLFVPGSGAEQSFKRTGEMAKSVTRIGKGPNGMTIIADPEVNIDKYLEAVGSRPATEKK